MDAVRELMEMYGRGFLARCRALGCMGALGKARRATVSERDDRGSGNEDYLLCLVGEARSGVTYADQG